MTKAEKIKYRGIWNKYNRQWRLTTDSECRKMYLEKLINLEEILQILTNGELNKDTFRNWHYSVNLI